jgi:prepilin-type N-terminal cleavage/methylation domain-containing protein
MLKINKILLRKIKSPLSLRGLFPFCHSRESGNPSHLSLRGEKRRSNLNGFSLIELMVAAVILAIALLGIFQAYSVGFMGMADARDRTVATNYLRETIEDFKNMNFNKVKDEPITLIPGTKFHRGSIVLDLEKKGEVVTLKKVITQVRWMDRKGNIKTEEASTILYNKPNTSEVSDAGGIILYATPYYTILPNHEVELTAEIKDNNGNTITDWEGDITFSIITNPPNDPQVGNITTPQPVPATNGVAICTFLAISGESVEGIEKIQASANLTEIGEVTDTVNIRVSTGAVGIVLEPVEGDEILPTDETATINVTVVKADYITPITYGGDITLSTTGPGTLSNNTINGVPLGQTTVTLTSTGTPGVVEITASATDLDMGYTEVTFTGEAKSILVSAKKKSIYPDEETTITVTIVDENNKPVVFGASDNSKIVTLSAAPDYGIFDDNSNPINLTFEGESSKTCVFKASSMGEFPQEVTITASDSLVELNSGSTNIEILSPLVAHHIDVTFDPSIIELDV